MLFTGAVRYLTADSIEKHSNALPRSGVGFLRLLAGCDVRTHSCSLQHVMLNLIQYRPTTS